MRVCSHHGFFGVDWACDEVNCLHVAEFDIVAKEVNIEQFVDVLLLVVTVEVLHFPAQ